MTALRICFVGDSLVAGVGDARYLGWPGRLCAAERARGHDVTLYNLGIRRDTSALVAARWRAECAARLPDLYPGALVFAFGVNDTGEESPGRLRVALDDTLRHARAVLAGAASWKPTLMIGPAPLDEAKMALGAEPSDPDFRDARVGATSKALAGVAAEIGVPYLDLLTRLTADPRFARALIEGDGVHPTADGYALIAETIGAWLPWRKWFDG